MVDKQYDVLILGGGGAGITAALTAKGFGKTAAIIEKKRMGGECTNSGCVPSKALIKSAAIAHQWKKRHMYGLSGAADIDTTGVLAHVREVIEQIYQTETPEHFAEQGIPVITGEPRFIDAHTVEVNGEKVSGNYILIATGSGPMVPPIEGLSSVPYYTNETIFQMEKIPSSMLVLGGGAIGVELAQALQRLGTKVTVIEMMDRILFREDEELSSVVIKRLTNEGIAIHAGTKAVSLAPHAGRVILNAETAAKEKVSFEADAVLVAVGRRAHVEGLGLEAASVKYSPRGITVNAKLQSSQKHIYAAGDVVGPYQFSHMAEYQAVVAVMNMVLPVSRKVNYAHVPWCTFTDPELAHSGLTEDEARKKYGDTIRVYRVPYSTLDRAITDGESEGLGKYICDKKGRILGIHIVGHTAGDIMHEAHALKTLGIPLQKLQQVIHVYPTYADITRKAAKMAYLDVLRNNLFIRMLNVITGKRG